MSAQMVDNLSRAVRILREDGILSLLQSGLYFIYNRRIAPLFPETNAEYNGVKVNDYSTYYFDSIVPWRKEKRPYYESGLISGLEEHVKEGDRVAIVGGGWGVTAVKSAQIVGKSGKVIVFEGSADKISHIQETVTMNKVSNNVDVDHCIVGPAINLRGEARGANHISPDELPECDVLELDCEGAEIEILDNMTIRPRVILVESHGMYDAPSSKIENLLMDNSYSVKLKEVADKGNREKCIDNDIYSISAVIE